MKTISEPAIERLNYDRVLALMGEHQGARFEALVEGEWVPIGRLLTWGEFDRAVPVRMVRDHFSANKG